MDAIWNAIAGLLVRFFGAIDKSIVVGVVVLLLVLLPTFSVVLLPQQTICAKCARVGDQLSSITRMHALGVALYWKRDIANMMSTLHAALQSAILSMTQEQYVYGNQHMC